MQFTVKNRICSCLDSSIIGDNADYTAIFEFDEEWTGVTKTARFVSKDQYTDVILSNDQCTIPQLKQSITEIGVYSSNMTTTPCYVNVEPSIKEHTAVQASPTYSVYEQVLSRLDELEVSTVSDEAIEIAVSAYLEDNPIAAGLSQQEVESIVNNIVDTINIPSTDGLASTNYVDNGLSQKSDENHTHADLHTHSNKSVLDGITTEKVNAWDNKSTFNGDYNNLTNKPSIPSVEGLASEAYVTTVIESLGDVDLSGYATTESLTNHTSNSNIHVTLTKKSEWDAKSDFSGSYDDLANKPIIPTITNDLTNELKTNYDNAVTNSHTHSNKSVLDTINSVKKAEWDAKSDFSGSYNDLTNKPTIPSITGLVTTTELETHTNNSNIHVTYTDKANWSAKADEINIVTTTSRTLTCNANTIYNLGTLASTDELDLTFPTSSMVHVTFIAGATDHSISLNSSDTEISIEWKGIYEFDVGTTYEISVYNNVAIVG